MIGAIMDALMGFVEGIFDLFVNGGTLLVSLFYDTTTSELTFWGTLALLGLGITLSLFVIRWISSLIRR